MSNKKIHLVVQQGGSSAEFYANWYDTPEEARDYIDDCYKHTYRCLGPFEIELGDQSDEVLVTVADLIGTVLRDAVMEN